jgi:hypothetical protein
MPHLLEGLSLLIIVGGLRSSVKKKQNWLIFPALIELGEQRNRYLA